MEWDFLTASVINLLVNLLYTVLALIVGVFSLLWVDKKLLKNVDIESELQKGNLAISIFASSILAFVAVLVAFGFRG